MMAQMAIILNARPDRLLLQHTSIKMHGIAIYISCIAAAWLTTIMHVARKSRHPCRHGHCASAISAKHIHTMNTHHTYGMCFQSDFDSWSVTAMDAVASFCM